MDFLAPLIDFLRPFQQAVLVVIGGSLTLAGVIYQSKRAYRLELRRESRDFHRTLIQTLVEERQNGFGAPGSMERLRQVSTLLEFLPSEKRGWLRRKRRRGVRQLCKEAIMWIEAIDDHDLQGFSKLRPSEVHFELSKYAQHVLGASLRGEALPERPPMVEKLEKAQVEVEEIHQENMQWMSAEKDEGEP